MAKRPFIPFRIKRRNTNKPPNHKKRIFFAVNTDTGMLMMNADTGMLVFLGGENG